MLLNAAGNPVTTLPFSCQIDLPCEPSTESAATAPNFWAITQAMWQLYTAVKTGNPVAIMAAFQALLNAIKGG